MGADTDEEIVRRYCETGDQRFFVELMGRYANRLRRLLCTVIPGAPEDREDAEQEILSSLYIDLKRFRFQSTFSTYFYRYCRNKAIDLIRRNQRERRKVAALKLHVRTATFPVSAEDVVVRNERESEVIAAVMELPADDRALLFLKESEGLSVADIAQILTIPEGTVKSRLHRARNRAIAILQLRERRHRFKVLGQPDLAQERGTV